MAATGNDTPGPATDARGRVVIDPTVLTTELMQRELATIRRELESRQETRQREHAALEQLINTRLEAMDKATEIRLVTINAVPTLIEKARHDQDRLTDEKFAGIALQFKERDTRTTQAAETSQKALDAALLAAAALVNQQNEANATAATVQTLSFTKQIDQIIVLTERQQKSSDDRLAELKERIDRGDGSSAGARVATTDQRSNSNLIIAIVTAMLFVVSVGVSVVAIILR